jgi:hypothetical protein
MCMNGMSPAYVRSLPCRSPAAKKRLAVPFRAADTPAERSEYAQPDVALLLTVLRLGLQWHCNKGQKLIKVQ